MTMVATRNLWPNPYWYPLTALSTTLDATGERYGQVHQILHAGSIIKIHFYIGVVTAADTVKVSIYTVDMDTGLPTTTVWPTSTGNKAYGTVAVSGVGWQTVTLTEAATVAQGDWIAVVFEWSSYDSGNLRFYHSLPGGSMQSLGNALCTIVTDITAKPGTWAKYTYPGIMASQYEYSDGYHNNEVPTAMPCAAAYSLDIDNTGANPDEVGNYFQVPFKMRVCGLWIFCDMDYPVTLSLLDASNNVLANAVTDDDCRFATTYKVHHVPFDADPAATYTLATGTWYRMLVTPGSDAVKMYYFDTVSAAGMGAFEGGTSYYATSRVDGGAWTNLTTRRWAMGLMIDQIDDGTGTGGGIWMPRARQIGV